MIHQSIDINENLDEETKREKDKKEKQHNLDLSVRKTLVECYAKKYNLTISKPQRIPSFFYQFMKEETESTIKLEVNNAICNEFTIKSFRFNSDLPLLDFVMRTITMSPSCTAEDYYKLALLFIDRKDISTNKDSITKLLNLSLSKGYRLAKIALFCHTNNSCHDWEKIDEEYHKLLDDGFDESEFQMASNNINEALTGMKKIKQNDYETIWKYVNYCRQYNCDNKKTEIKYLKILASAGDVKALQQLSDKLYVTKSMDKHRETLPWQEKAAETGYKEAFFRAGRIYMGNITSGPIDLDKAIHYLTISSNQGKVEATYLLGIIYGKPEYSGYDLKKAVKYLDEAKLKGNKDAGEYLYKLLIKKITADKD